MHADAERPLWLTDASSVWGVSQAVKGLPWLLEGVGNSSWNYPTRPDILNGTMDIKYFANDNLTMNVDGNTVSFRYKFRDFQGENIVPAPWEAVLKARCQILKSTLNVDTPLTSNTNIKDFELKKGNLRWINRLQEGAREEPIQVCK